MVLAGLTSCTNFDDPTTENYGAGPGIDVQIKAGTPTDSAFTVTITPAAGAAYYAYIIDANDEAEQLDSATLYKGGYGNAVVKVADQPTTTINIDNAAPNTTYQVYAVAGSDKGVVGNIVVKSIKTTDALRPTPGRFTQGSEQKAVQIAFSEVITRGTGAVTGKYYKEWDWDNPVALTAEDIDVTISKNVIQLTAPNTPDGAFVLFSWEEGAFVDAKGNKCAAFTTEYDEEEDDFIGYWVQNKKVAFEIDDSYVTAPADGALIANVADFQGTITFPFNVYRNDAAVKAGALSVTFTNASRTATYKLSADDWTVKDSVISYVLPATPVGGDFITVSLVEGAVADVLGNPNAAYTSKAKWQFFAPTKDMVLGSFNYFATIGEKTYDLGPFSIVENAEAENGLILKDFYLEGAQVPAVLDLANAKFYVEDLAYIGIEEEEEEDGSKTPYAIYTYNMSDNKLGAPFTINADGTLSSEDLILVGSPDDEHLYYWVKSSETVFQRSAATARGAKAKKHVSKKGKMLNVKLSSLRK